MVETADELVQDKSRHYKYPDMTKTLGSFKLTVEAGSFTDSEIIVMLGENGMGKTTLIRLLAGRDDPDDVNSKMSLSVSLKPQKIAPKFAGTVRMLLLKQIKAMFMHPQFQTDVVKPMSIDPILDQEVKTLSGGELQRVAIVLALGVQVRRRLHSPHHRVTDKLVSYRRTSIFWMNPPHSSIPSSASSLRRSSSGSSCMPREPRLSSSTTSSWRPTLPIVSWCSKGHPLLRLRQHRKYHLLEQNRVRTEGRPSRPQSLLTGMNQFLASLEITFRRDPTNFRPRVNKAESMKDREQKGKSYLLGVGAG